LITVYLLAPGTQVSVSRSGAEFETPHAIKVQLQFTEPVEVTDTTMTFVDGRMRLKVDRAAIIVARFDGLGGTN
jgi:hypothetical protein